MRLENSLLNIYSFYCIILARLGNREKITNLGFIRVLNYNIYYKEYILKHCFMFLIF